jgi:hypothetical protein
MSESESTRKDFPDWEVCLSFPNQILHCPCDVFDETATINAIILMPAV